ncbi:MAG: glycosyltransferase family 4 protein [Parcubacteria group bacterium]
MKLLVITQKIDKNDPVLGFFHTWVEELSKVSESVNVICLEKGEFSFDNNVKVYSLGKEGSVSRLAYLLNFYKHLYKLRGEYDSVFVHMNQEYVLLGGLYWRLCGIPIYLWRNHPVGNFITTLAVGFATKVFCTAPNSFTASFKKTVIMPVGYDSKTIKSTEGTVRKKYSILMLGRVSPVKNIDLGVRAVDHLIKSGTQVSLSIVGSPPKRDINYYENLKKMVLDFGISNNVTFAGEVPKTKISEIFSGHEIFLNLTNSFDKTVVESVACGTMPIVSNLSLGNFLPEVCITKDSPEEIAKSLQRLLNPTEQVKIKKDLEYFVESQSLDALVRKLNIEMKQNGN